MRSSLLCEADSQYLKLLEWEESGAEAGERVRGPLATNRKDDRVKSGSHHFFKLEVSRVSRLPGRMRQW